MSTEEVDQLQVGHCNLLGLMRESGQTWTNHCLASLEERRLLTMSAERNEKKRPAEVQ